MMTQKRLEYFLQADTISDDEYFELVEEFFKEYEEKKIRKFTNYIEDFWVLIRKYIIPKGRENKYYDFEFFYFPSFEFYPDSIDGRLLESANFWNAGEMTVFDGDVNFSDTTFLSWFNLAFVEFQGNVIFKHTQFKGKTDFVGAIFSKFTNFAHCCFVEESSFDAARFNHFVQIAHCKFERKATFNSVSLNEANIQDIKSDQDNLLSFANINFSKNITFRRVDMRNIHFTQSDISDVQFKECVWEITSRLHISEEQILKYSRDEYEMLEEQYRQLKKNFDSNKDWELSGKAYVSEMEMRKKRLWLQKDYYHWFIYWFYDKCSGYTQNLKKPIFSLLILMAVFSCIYYPIDQSIQWAIQRGIYGALPKLITIDIPKDAQFNGYWLIASNIETLLGSTFLVFFILALRKRFKQ